MSITLHLKTQRGQPYGSVRRCCEMCGIMIWNKPPADGGEWTDDPGIYAEPPTGYTPCRSSAASPPAALDAGNKGTDGGEACGINEFSSRICERGTKGCTVTHGMPGRDAGNAGTDGGEVKHG